MSSFEDLILIKTNKQLLHSSADVELKQLLLIEYIVISLFLNLFDFVSLNLVQHCQV